VFENNYITRIFVICTDHIVVLQQRNQGAHDRQVK